MEEIGGYNEHNPVPYKSIKNQIFNRYKEKARMLSKAIDKSRLNKGDKQKLKNAIKEIIS